MTKITMKNIITKSRIKSKIKLRPILIIGLNANKN